MSREARPGGPKPAQTDAEAFACPHCNTPLRVTVEAGRMGSKVPSRMTVWDGNALAFTDHPAGGLVLVHPDHPARWIKPDGSIEEIAPAGVTEEATL